MDMATWLCEGMYVGKPEHSRVHMHVEARYQHWLSSLITPHVIF